MMGGLVFGLGGSFNHQQPAVFGARLRFDEVQQQIAHAPALPLRVNGNPV